MASTATPAAPPAMASLATHPANAEQARAFTAPSSLSFPGGAGDLTPPSSEKDGQQLGAASGTSGANANGQQPGGSTSVAANGVTPATPAATPGAVQGVSGIVPTLQ
jgi:transcription initiation factor TFIID TATA-box-binding protein